MFDMSSKFNTFYSSHVVLSQADQHELYRKKDINIQRLKDGLKEYNDEHGTSFIVVETCVQGSVAMSTVVQNENKDYDIDVAVVFKKSDVEEIGSQAIKNVVADALSRRTKQFNAKPEIKTSCVRVKYAEGYHIDFAVYRRFYDIWNDCWVYEHAGSDWSTRELKGLTDWFKKQNDASEENLRKIIRLSKMFCKSRDLWTNMPSGLLQTVLCDEKLKTQYSRLDELFYYTFINEKSRHNYEIDFLIARKNKICPVEVKSSGYKTHASLDAFCEKYSGRILQKYLIYTKDYGKDADVVCLPVYMTPFI